MNEQEYADKIRQLALDGPEEINQNGKAVIDAILFLIDYTCLNGDLEKEYEEWSRASLELWCDTIHEHDWTNDHCGWWGHQYCPRCRQSKYPEFKGNHSDHVGFTKITEENYLKGKESK
jgi:hypothetical protein